MNEREFFEARRKAEKEIFLRVIRALPEGRLDYKPHERSPTALQILTTLVAEHDSCARLVRQRVAGRDPVPERVGRGASSRCGGGARGLSQDSDTAESARDGGRASEEGSSFDHGHAASTRPVTAG